MSGSLLPLLEQLLRVRLIGIPLASPLSWVYAIVNLALLMYATVFGTGGSSGGGLLSFLGL